MPISDKTRKVLWGRSGNRCAICKKELVIDPTPNDPESIVGEECHIHSAQGKGPRHDSSFDSTQLDDYSNLVLLCRIDHKRVDDQSETYTAEILRTMKANHEKWVKEKLDGAQEEKPIRFRRVKGATPEFLFRIQSGKQALDLVTGCLAYSFSHDEMKSKEDAEIVGALLQDLQNWGDLHLEPAESVRVAFEIGQRISELESIGLLLFGATEKQILEGGSSGPKNWPIAILKILYSENADIVKLDLSEDESESKKSPDPNMKK
jgi:hypothetical protein